MTLYPKGQIGSEKLLEDCTGENFVHEIAVLQIDCK